jgi:SAM-dependent methyltransferase
VYDEGYYRYREATRDFSIEAELIFRMLDTSLNVRVLEVGCGGGALLAFMREHGLDPTGSDLLPEAVRLAREAAPGCEVIEADAARLPFPDASFDRLVSHHLVEHLPDLPATLAEWKRVLSPGGVMVICTPNRLYGSPRIFADPSHLHIYDRAELVRGVEESGFMVEESFTIFPHLLRDRVSVKLGVPAWRLFYRLPWFKERGRTLLLRARH